MPLDIEGNYLKKFKNNISTFIETGTLVGDGIQSALNAGFEKFYSVELSDNFFNICKNKFLGNKNINLFLGSSEQELPKILDQIDEPFLLWLDAHTSGGDTVGEPMHNYLPRELKSIVKHTKKFKDSVIMIDDMGYYIDNKDFCNQIETLVKQIKPNGKIEYYYPEGTDWIILVCK